jgi:N-acetylneuraminate lyase
LDLGLLLESFNMIEHIKGLVAAPYTAMNSDCSINLDVIERQANFLAKNRVSGAFICGTTGEGALLTTQEKKDITTRWTDVSPDGLKVIVHVGGPCLEDCKTLAAHAQWVGAWGIGAIAPSFFKPRNVEDLVSFCAEVAASAPSLPFYFYHMPSMTGVNFPMIRFLEQASKKIPNLAGIKYTYEDLMDYQLCIAFEDGRYDMLFGRDEILVCGLSLGARGAVGSTYNFASPLYNNIIAAFDEGDLVGARKLQKKSVDLIQLLFQTPASFQAVGKSVMKILGIDCGPVRPPLTNMTQMAYENLKGLAELGFFEYCSQGEALEIPCRKDANGVSIREIKIKAKRTSTADSKITK